MAMEEIVVRGRRPGAPPGSQTSGWFGMDQLERDLEGYLDNIDIDIEDFHKLSNAEIDAILADVQNLDPSSNDKSPKELERERRKAKARAKQRAENIGRELPGYPQDDGGFWEKDPN